jgi:hypothetical protein
VPIARYFIFVGGTLAALLFIASSRLPTPPAIFADQSVGLGGAVIRVKSAHKWPEKVILDTSQLIITPPIIVDPPAIQSAMSDKARNRSNLEAMALLKPDTQPAAIRHPTLQIKRGVATAARSKRVVRGPVAQQKWAARAAGLGGSMTGKPARMLRRRARCDVMALGLTRARLAEIE